ncbi:MAG: ATP-binding cassette domain-containing protein [Chloroflexi bacterium]|nr:ATP-binding cassette domain-containing protein [Chloroflexota bacterium]
MIKIEHMTKFYGSFPAVIDVSMHIKKGEVVGFLGPNGAGKTTTMRVMTGYTPPSEGTVTIAGYDVITHSLEARRHIGYLPETVPLYLDMEVTDYLRFMGQMRGMNRAWINERLPAVIDVVKLGDYRNTYIQKLSKGFRQRVGIAQSILHEPDVLIMDEPTIGIDPVQVVETRALIKELGGEHTLILSSHILPEISMICRRVIVIHEGRLVADDEPGNLSERLRRTERIELAVRGAGEPGEVISMLRDLPMIVDARRDNSASAQRDAGEGIIPFLLDARPDREAPENVAKAIVEKGWGLINMHVIPMSLEEIFLELTTDESLEG